MIKVSVMYPNSPDATFDIDYYCNSHVPMVGEKLGAALKGVSVDSGLAGSGAGEAALFIAIGHLIFDSVEDFQQAFGPKTEEIMSDLANFTNIQPQIQISEIKI